MSSHTKSRLVRAVSAATVLVLITSSALGQPMPRCEPPPGVDSRLPQEFRPWEPQFAAAQAFAESLSANDARIQIMVGQGRLLTLKEDLTAVGEGEPLIAVGDETILDFEVVGPRHLRLVGRRIGITDLSIVTSDGVSHGFEVAVIADLGVLSAQLRQAFPDAVLNLSQLREHVVVEGQARDTRQVAQIVATIAAYLDSVQVARQTRGQTGVGRAAVPPAVPPGFAPEGEEMPYPAVVTPDVGRPSGRVTLPEAQIINLIRVPGPQQVLLKVQVAELNRTALRQLGTSFLFQNSRNAVGSGIGPIMAPAEGAVGGEGLYGLLSPILGGGPGGTVFGVFDGGRINFFLNALRRNQVFKILAEPNLVAMHGQEANFLSGGEFPVPVPQPGGAGGIGLVTIEYREFGVGLTFVPYILDGDTIRLSVAPEVSSLDFSTGVIIQGTAVPGLATRRTSTVVELREGQTLAISGILQVTLDGNTDRIPGLGDLPYIGAMFSNNSTTTVEKELVVLVTPYLIQPLDADHCLPLPGDDVLDPTDCEFYLKQRIERRVHEPYRATLGWDDPLGVDHRYQLESRYICGPYGYSD
jgi:pilus assembly protein CpaC